MNMKKIIVLFLFMFPLLGLSQNALDFRQFYFNPFFFNPAYAGSSGFTEFTLAYRQQWMDFTDSPVASGFTVQHPFKNRSSLGINIFTQKSVAMRTSSTQVAYAYRVPLGGKHSLRFALSGGLGIDDLDLEGRDYSNDPLILQAAQNQVYLQGSFGMLYTKGEFQAGFTLPTLFNHQEIGAGPLKIHPLQHLTNQLYTLRYKLNLQDNRFSLEPYLLYRLNRDLQNYFEVATLVHFKNQIRAGLSYHQYNGVGIFLGMTFKNQYSMGYGYEVPRKKYTGSGAHEFQLAVRMGEERHSAE